MAGVPRTENTGMDGGPCGKGAVLLRLLGRKSLASSTLAPSASRSAVIGHGIGPGIQSAKRVGSAWRNAVGHTCPMRSRTFLLGVTAAHGSLEPIVLVRNQEEEHNRRLRQPAVGNGLQNRERWVRPPQPPLSGSILRFDFFLYTRTMCCTGHTGFFGITPGRENDAIALVAQWIERPPPERKATSPILVEGTHKNSANHNARSPLLLFSLKPSRLVRVRASRGNALVAQRIERRFPKPGAAGPTPAMGTMPC